MAALAALSAALAAVTPRRAAPQTIRPKGEVMADAVIFLNELVILILAADLQWHNIRRAE